MRSWVAINLDWYGVVLRIRLDFISKLSRSCGTEHIDQIFWFLTCKPSSFLSEHADANCMNPDINCRLDRVGMGAGVGWDTLPDPRSHPVQGIIITRPWAGQFMYKPHFFCCSNLLTEGKQNGNQSPCIKTTRPGFVWSVCIWRMEIERHHSATSQGERISYRDCGLGNLSNGSAFCGFR